MTDQNVSYNHLLVPRAHVQCTQDHSRTLSLCGVGLIAQIIKVKIGTEGVERGNM